MGDVNKDLKWFNFSQNNSYGGFDIDEHVAHEMFIQASNFEEANDLAESIGCYFNGVDDGIDCSCRGNRWHALLSDCDAINLPYGVTIERYAQSVVTDSIFLNQKAYIYYYGERKPKVIYGKDGPNKDRGDDK